MYAHTTEIRVRYGETDQMGYLYYGYYALYYEQGRTDAIRNLGMSYKDMEAQGVMMPVVAMECKYLRPAFYDDMITVKTIVKELPTQSLMEFHSELYNEAGKLLNTATVTLAFYDMKLKRKTTAPTALIETLKVYFS